MYPLRSNMLCLIYFFIKIKLIIFNKSELNLNLFYINHFVQYLLNLLYIIISLYLCQLVLIVIF